MRKQAENLKKTINPNRILSDVQYESCKSDTIQFHEECNYNLSFLNSLGKSQALPNMSELVKGLANTPAKLFHEKQNLLTFLDTLIKYGISRDPEGIEVLLVGSNRDEKNKLRKVVKDSADGKNGQNQMRDLQSFSDTGENTTTTDPRNDEGVPMELNITSTAPFAKLSHPASIWLSSPIFPCSFVVRPSVRPTSVTSPLISTI